MNPKTFLILILSVGWAFSLWSQEQVHVVSKKMGKEFPYRDGYEVNIEGDRAEVFIEPNLNNAIEIRVEIEARHPEKATAERDVERIAYLAKRVKNKIYIRNYLDNDGTTTPPESQLKVVYHITVPAECPVYVKNAYGFTEVSRLNNRLKVNSKFSQVNLDQVVGSIDLFTRYGDIYGESLDGNISIGARRTNITLRNMAGSYDINAQYGLIQLFAGAGLTSLNLDAEKSDVMLFNEAPDAFSYQLTAVNSRVHYPDELNFAIAQPEPNIQKFTFTPTNEFYPNITIRVTFGDMQLNRSPKVKRP